MRRVAQHLGYGVESLRGWVKQTDIDAGIAPGVTSAEQARIKELEQEFLDVKRGRDPAFAHRRLRGGARPPTEVMVAFIERHEDEFGIELNSSKLPIAPSTDPVRFQ